MNQVRIYSYDDAIRVIYHSSDDVPTAFLVSIEVLRNLMMYNGNNMSLHQNGYKLLSIPVIVKEE